MRPLIKYPKVEYSITRLGSGQTSGGQYYAGGLDLTTPSLSLQPGALRRAQNFECSQSGGYTRIKGYERYDGRFPFPSLATWVLVQFPTFNTIPAVGDVLIQDVSGASGFVIAVNMAGSFYVVMSKVIGTFDTVNPVKHGANLVGIPIPPLAIISAKLSAQYTAMAANLYRADIMPVPGSGPVLDVFHLIVSGLDQVYAFRADATGTTVNLYQATSSGWAQIPFFNTVSFTASTVLPKDGDTLTQGGKTATIKRVVWASGTTAAGSAAGQMVITNPVGGNFAAGAATSSSGGVVTLSGAQTAITIAPGGTWEHEKYNFFGAAGRTRIYGCDGLNKGYEFDGTTYVPIPTGATPDAPKHVTAHKGYLVFSTMGSIMGSAPSNPYKWTATDGAWEIATGGVVTGMVTVPGAQTTATLAVFQKENTAFLYGLDRASFNYVTFNTGIGALAGSVQNLFDVFVFDALGVITIQTTLNFGNFSSSTLTKGILPLVIQQRTKVVTSCVYHTKNQYRVFFNDGQAFYISMFNQQYLGAMPVLFPNPVNCIDVADEVDGDEVAYFGSSDTLGYVYQMEMGTSFDGKPIDAYITLAWDPVKSPRVLKHWRAGSVEMQGLGFAEIRFGYALGYNSVRYAQPMDVALTSAFSSSFWDSMIWDNFIWDGQTLAPSDVDMGGTSENIQVTIASETDYIIDYTVNSVIYHYTPRRGLRV